jgi:hypothetical protein
MSARRPSPRVGEPIAMAPSDPRHAQSLVEQIVERAMELGFDGIRAAGGLLDVERDDRPVPGKVGYRRSGRPWARERAGHRRAQWFRGAALPRVTASGEMLSRRYAVKQVQLQGPDRVFSSPSHFSMRHRAAYTGCLHESAGITSGPSAFTIVTGG